MSSITYEHLFNQGCRLTSVRVNAQEPPEQFGLWAEVCRIKRCCITVLENSVGEAVRSWCRDITFVDLQEGVERCSG